MKLSEVKTSVKLSVGEAFYKFFQWFLFVSLLVPLPQICLQVVFGHLDEATGYFIVG
jgi:hypothetical protein